MSEGNIYNNITHKHWKTSYYCLYTGIVYEGLRISTHGNKVNCRSCLINEYSIDVPVQLAQ